MVITRNNKLYFDFLRAGTNRSFYPLDKKTRICILLFTI